MRAPHSASSRRASGAATSGGSLLLLREQRPDLTVRTIGTPPTGLGMVLNPDPHSNVLGERCAGLIAEYLGKDFEVLAGRQAEALGLVPNEWPAIRALLDARAHS